MYHISIDTKPIDTKPKPKPMASSYQKQHQPYQHQGPYYTATGVPPQYYQPPPPSQPNHHRAPCACCLLNTLVKLLIATIVAVSILIIVLWFVLRPQPLKVHVTSASLSTFNLTSTNTLRHNLSIELAVRNPNKHVGVYYDWLEAYTYYDGAYGLQWIPLPTFYQGHKNTTTLRAVLAGETRVDSSGVGLYGSQRKEGAFDIEVRLYGWIRYRVGSITTRERRLRVSCWMPVLRLQGGDGFVGTKCDVY